MGETSPGEAYDSMANGQSLIRIDYNLLLKVCKT